MSVEKRQEKRNREKELKEQRERGETEKQGKKEREREREQERERERKKERERERERGRELHIGYELLCLWFLNLITRVTYSYRPCDKSEFWKRNIVHRATTTDRVTAVTTMVTSDRETGRE